MYRSDASGVNGTWVKAANQPWNQSYHLAISMQNPLRQTTGLQDNGSQVVDAGRRRAGDADLPQPHPRPWAEHTGTPRAAATVTGT